MTQVTTIVGGAPKEVALFVKRGADAEFRITGDPNEIGQIGDLLRGKSQFSWFNSVILPAGVAILTILAGLVFQYIGWLNDISVQAIKDVVAKAESVQSKATNAMDQFYYRTFVVVDAVQDLAPKKAISDNALTSSLSKLDDDRVDTYYSTLGLWSIEYSQVLNGIQAALDIPIYIQAKWSKDQINKESIPVSSKQTQGVDCTRSLIEQVEKMGYASYNLKAQFAVIHGCYSNITSDYGNMKKKILDSRDQVASSTIAISTASEISDLNTVIKSKLDGVSTMSNVFRCYAEDRVAFYQRESGYAILSPIHLLTKLSNWGSPATRAKDELAGADEACNSYLGLTRSLPKSP